jgi:hypothetical protein
LCCFASAGVFTSIIEHRGTGTLCCFASAGVFTSIKAKGAPAENSPVLAPAPNPTLSKVALGISALGTLLYILCQTITHAARATKRTVMEIRNNPYSPGAGPT